MEQLADQQVDLTKHLSKLKESFDQLSEERRTSKLVEERLKKINDIWDIFERNDSEIRASYAGRLEHPYFTKDLYNQMEELFNSFKNRLLQKLKELQITKETPGNNVGGEKNKETSQGTSQNMVQSEETDKIEILFSRIQRYILSLNTTLSSILIHQQTKRYYEFNIAHLQEKWTKLRDYDEEIWSKCKDPSKYGYSIDEIDGLEIRVNEMILQLNEQLADQKQMPTENIRSLACSKLPAITLPKFDGNYSEWMNFHDMFREVIDKQSLSKVEKMWHLKGNLTGEAERLIRHLSVTEQNYDIAWQVLQDRYNNKRLLVSTIIDKFMGQPNITAGSAKSLKNMFDVTKECVLSLENLRFRVNGFWDPILLQILYKKLDKDTHTYYEQSLEFPREMQTIDKFMKFIETRFQSLEALGNIKSKQYEKPQQKSSYNASALQTNDNSFKCAVCGGAHLIYNCQAFIKLTPVERESKIKKLNLCLNCFRTGHYTKTCYSRGCKRCSQKHNTLLHKETCANQHKPKNASNNMQVSNQNTKTASVHTGAIQNKERNYIFLGTVIATIIGKNNKTVDCRIMLDSGSQLNFITEKLKRQLKLDSCLKNIEINGIGNHYLTSTTDKVNVTLKSKVRDFSMNIEAQVIKEITTEQPQIFINIDAWKIPENIKLADPKFNQPQRVDMLLGAETYSDLMRTGKIKIQQNLPVFQETVFGWMVLGKASKNMNFVGVSNQQLDEELSKFWECEEVSEKKPLSKIDSECDKFFMATTHRDQHGRFIINLPIMAPTELLGESKHLAMRRFLNLEKKLEREAQLKKEYSEFLHEYLQLGHMIEIDEMTITRPNYFLPHHCVIKQESSTTKLRVVFDASCKTTSNLSLNDLMMKGPTVQDELFEILLRFRTYKYVLTADIKQMYRQIKVSEEDQGLQLIMWRDNPQDKIHYYKLTTVTYGTRAAPYLATKCLQQLGIDESINYPLASNAMKDFYIDDVITGCNTLTELIELKKQLINLMKSAHFTLHKWSSNNEKLLDTIPEEYKEKTKIFKEGDTGYIKTLGLAWQPKYDIFSFTLSWPDINEKLTKRKVTSEMARLFDPLGLINPIVVIAKIFIQKLWKHKIDWDDELNKELRGEWINYRQELSSLHKLKVTRYLFNASEHSERLELHAFGDASEAAFGAVIYIRSIDIRGHVTCKMLCSKSKVAPIKFLSLPRLELCAAVLATKLVTKVKETLKVKIDEIYYWSDSQITLSWIGGDPATFKTYVAHRVSKIHNKSRSEQWNYVNTKENPADLLSRGVYPDQLMNSKLWFHGPPFLTLLEEYWPSRKISTTRIEEEERKIACVAYNNENSNERQHPLYAINHRNSFTFLKRSMAYILRAIKIMKKEDSNTSINLTIIELNEALKVIIKEIQGRYFKEEIHQLDKECVVSKHSKIASLSPFIDCKGILRVGGRLDNANIPYNAKYPILLPGEDFVSRLLLKNLHEEHLHAGPLTLLNISRQQYWIIKGRILARSITNDCVKCKRAKPQLFQQMMGNLPSARVLPARAFLNTGIDFCGPIWTHYHLRGKRPHKSYIVVFCCFATKAIHLEVVSDLTTEAFLGALKRFMARRGFCENIFCDNATNFVGAKNRIEELKTLFDKQEVQKEIITQCSNKSVQFHFSPPRTPHFGGLWEAAVKSLKKLLQQVLASASLTFEELCTVVAEAEAILNSRPLTPLSSDPADFTTLTPGHFLIGEPLTSLPQITTSENRLTALSRWKLVSAIRQELWKRWTQEYLTELQKRYKWQEPFENAVPGMVVILKDDNSPPLKWHMGRIIKVMPGSDGLVRKVLVKTATGIFERGVHKLAPLPIESEESSIEAKNTNGTKRHKHQESKSIKKKKRTEVPFSATAFVILTLMFMPLIMVCADPLSIPFNVTPLNNNAGIYFEKLGTGSAIKTEWKIITYYNLSSYWQNYFLLHRGVNKIQELASKTMYNHYTSLIAKEFEDELHEIYETNLLLFHNLTYQRRQKRGLINAVGNIANILFGVLDDNYARDIEDTINNIKSNQDKLLDLMKNQTSIIEATNHLFQESDEKYVKNFEKIHIELNEIVMRNNEMSSQIQTERLTQTFLIFSQYLILGMHKFKRMQQSMLDVIIDLHHGKTNPIILPPKQLLDHLDNIKTSLPTDLMLPNLSKIYSLISLQCKISHDYAIFLFQVPLLSVTEYDFIHLIPFPIKINNIFMKLEPATEFLMINRYMDEAYSLTKIEYEQCINLGNNHYGFREQKPIYTKDAKLLQCEFQLLKKQIMTHQCHLRVYTPVKTWIKLKQPNIWLFALNQQYVFNIVCDGQTNKVNLHGTGILSLFEDCTLKEDEITIQSYKTKTITFEISKQPFVLLPDDLNATLSKLDPLKFATRKINSFTSEYGKINEKIQALKLNEEYFPELSIHDKHQITVSYLALFAALICVIYLARKIFQRRPFSQPVSSSPASVRYNANDYIIDAHRINEAENV